MNDDKTQLTALIPASEANQEGGVRGFTALHSAALLDDVEHAEALLACGADIDAQDVEYGMTPLLEAMSEGDGDFRGPEVARLLIERGADVAIRDTKGRTVLDYAQDYYDCWIREADSVWLGRKQLDLIDLVRRAAAQQAL